jgi:hypothetical protein
MAQNITKYSRYDLTLWWLIPSCFAIIAAAMNSVQMSLIGLAITLAIFLLGQYLFRCHVRIERVTNEYLEILQSSGFTNELDALLKAGTCELSNRFELNQAAEKIRKRDKSAHDPLDHSILPRREVLAFLKWCQKNRKSISSGSDTLVVIAQYMGQIPNEPPHK